MRTTNIVPLATLSGLAIFLSGCSAVATQTATPVPPVTAPTPPAATAAGSVFTMDNNAAANNVLAFSRQSDGSLTQVGTYPTGGKGTGSGLGNQAALAFSTDKSLLYVVNAGSNDFSVFRIGATALTLLSRTPSGGAHPISITEHNGVVYVLNLDSFSGSAGFDAVTGFRVDSAGQVTPIPNSTRALSARSTLAAQVALSPDGTVLLVAERSTAIIDAFPLDSTGVPATTGILNPSNGNIPFGFQFLDATRVIFSEEGTNGASSYSVAATGKLTSISKSVPAFQAAVCWLAITPDGRFAYTGNTSGTSVSGYAVSPTASLTLLVPSGRSALTDGGALDLTVSGDNKYLYVVLTGGTLETFSIATDGSLTKVQSIPALGSINGVIAF